MYAERDAVSTAFEFLSDTVVLANHCAWRKTSGIPSESEKRTNPSQKLKHGKILSESTVIPALFS
jgi:hypothetical protein